MKFRFKDKAITGMLVVVPERERLFAEDMKLFHAPENRSRKLAMVMGYRAHRVVEAGVCASDMAEWGFRKLFAEGKVRPEEIDALVYVTLSPDHFVPPTSCILHGRLGLRRDCFCMDIAQGCCGFVVGLLQAFQLLEQSGMKKVAVVNADVLSRKVSPKDRNSYPLIGDAATIAMVENRPGNGKIVADIRFDGTRAMALRIPAGGFRRPSTPETAIMVADAEGNERSSDHLVMDGTAVFNFVMADVPPMLADLVKDAGTDFSGVEKYYFHQPNRFMLQKLAEKLDVPYEKMPNNVVEHYGNSSGATIPSAMALNDAEALCAESRLVCFSGFGVGLTYGGIVMNCGNFGFCETAEYPNEGE